ncbi:MAG: A/G-specific adenine glycosylase [Acidobacteria bacterium]|nr:A/G-specific adenine glycosylase [Acidobacteriota bacterium]
MRKALARWYGGAKRDLPWRRTSEPYPVWVSEIMLQQTRVAAALPYYERFLQLFPTVESLAEAPEQELLAVWSGLGYYSRARNLQKAARQIVAAGGFPRTFEGLRELAGIGDYTAAAVASISFGLPHAVLDGNVMRVLTRLLADAGDIQSPKTRSRLAAVAQEFLDKRAPAEHNQAVMELGALVCAPREPQCLLCPLAAHCVARLEGRAGQFPVKLRKQTKVEIALALLVIEREGRVLVWQRGDGEGRMAGFWELPSLEQLPAARVREEAGGFRHTITHHLHTVQVFRAVVKRVPAGYHWRDRRQMGEIPLSTMARKALRVADVD